MRYRLVALMLFVVLPVMNVLAAQAPEPYAILDLGPPPKDETAKQYREKIIRCTNLSRWAVRGVVSRGKEVAFGRSNEGCSPLAGEKRSCHSRGHCAPPPVYLPRRNSRGASDHHQRLSPRRPLFPGDEYQERRGIDPPCEKDLLELETRIKSSRDRVEAASYKRGINEIRSIQIPASRTDIARRKQYAVIQWAK